MKANLPLRVLIVFAAIALAAETAFACSCGPAPPVLGAYERASAVVIARVLSIEPFKDEDDSRILRITKVSEYGVATFVVEKAYKGKLRVNEQFTYGAYLNAACFWSIRKEAAGHRFLLYLSAFEGHEGWFVYM